MIGNALSRSCRAGRPESCTARRARCRASSARPARSCRPGPARACAPCRSIVPVAAGRVAARSAAGCATRTARRRRAARCPSRSGSCASASGATTPAPSQAPATAAAIIRISVLMSTSMTSGVDERLRDRRQRVADVQRAGNQPIRHQLEELEDGRRRRERADAERVEEVVTKPVPSSSPDSFGVAFVTALHHIVR